MTVDRERLRAWLHERLAQPNIRTRLMQFATTCESLSGIPAEAMTEADLGRIWLDVRNGVSELPSTSANLYNAQRLAVLRAATAIAQRLTEPPGARLVDLYRFFRLNGEPTAQLAHYVRAAALFDPGHIPTVIAYRTLSGAMAAALGYTGEPTPWERLIQEERAAELDAAFGFAFNFVGEALPDADVYERAVALELTPGFVKDQARLEGKPIAPRAAYVAPPPAPLPPRPDISERRPQRSSPDARRRSPRPRRED
ncbi:MAG: hypothetical protein ACYDBJ_24085 [Aggregatilineales bacterium]